MTNLKALANAVRFLAVDSVQKASSGHPGLPLGMADVATVLFSRFLKFDTARPDWPNRDRFVLSAGHGSALLYALSYLTGYPRMTLEALRNFRQLGSLTPGHPERDISLGIEMTTGPLGQGLGAAVGMALAERMMNNRFGDTLVDHRTYVLASDGDLMEGISHESASLAGHLGLARLIVLFDDNGISIDGPVQKTTSDNVRQRFEACGWAVIAVDGHDPAAIADALAVARDSDRPTLIACKTIIGYGAPTKAGTAACHGSPLGEGEVAGLREALGWPHDPFVVPEEILSVWREAGRRARPDRDRWEAALAAHPEQAAFTRLQTGALPESLPDLIRETKRAASVAGAKVATRQASGAMLKTLVPHMPELVGGSADLTESNNTRPPEMAILAKNTYGGQYVPWGVREHGMVAAMNGLALHGGFIPYGGTFLVFSDYSFPAIRLGALMGARAIHVLTHDSIGLGEDGPTHQPVEHLAHLRMTPNLRVFRPADAVETAECWELALRHTGPSALVLSRQALPTLRTAHADENLCQQGGYILAEATTLPRQITLLATGSEVSLAFAARTQLEQDGLPTAVVSLPCCEIFDQQSPEYRAHVLGLGCVRVGVEAALPWGWERYLGPHGGFIGMHGFGVSAPANVLYRHFNITAEAVVAKAKELAQNAGGSLPRHTSRFLI